MAIRAETSDCRRTSEVPESISKVLSVLRQSVLLRPQTNVSVSASHGVRETVVELSA